MTTLRVSANPNCGDAIGDNAPLVVSSGVAGEAACEPNATFAYADNDDCPRLP